LSAPSSNTVPSLNEKLPQQAADSIGEPTSQAFCFCNKPEPVIWSAWTWFF